MITRRFGRTGLEMPVLSCGGMRYQHSWNDKEAEGITSEGQANLEACIRKALASGINHIETARGYGTSEVQLGKILPTLPRGEMIVQTKVVPTPAVEFRSNFEQSMANLQLGHVDLLSIHGINNRELWEETIRPGGALEAAREIIHEGRATFLGFSTHAPCDLIEEIMIGEDRMIHFSGERVCVCEGWGGRGLGEGHSVEQRAMAGKQPDWPLRRAPAAPLAP